MSRLARRAEIAKLARVLGLSEEQLAFLGTIDAQSIRGFREQASAQLFDADADRLRRIAAASRLLPVALIALIAEHVFGALLCARVAGLLAPDRAAQVALRLRTAFLADVCLELDPRHVREVIARIPAAKIVEVGLLLVERREFVTVARFVEHVGDEATRAFLDALHDDAALLHIAFYVEERARLDRVVAMLPEERLRSIILLAADESRDLWAEALALINEVDPAWRKRLGEMAATLDESVVLSMARAAQAKGLWGAVLPIIAVLSPVHQRRLLTLPVLDDDAVLAAILAAADGEGLWQHLLPMVEVMDEPLRVRLAQQAEHLDDPALGRIFRAAQEQRLWGPLLMLVLRLPESVRPRIVPFVRKLSPEQARAMSVEAEKRGDLGRLEILLAAL